MTGRDPRAEPTDRRRCTCGGDVAHDFERSGCLECGAPCCAACAIRLESVTSCRPCAAVLLGAAAWPAGGRSTSTDAPARRP
jgi:hypothetical protein